MNIIEFLQAQADKANHIADKVDSPSIACNAREIANDLDYLATMINIGSFELEINMNVYVQKKYT